MRSGGASHLGGWGESEAAAYLRAKGYQIVASGYRSRFGEIDIIAKQGKTLVFIEVKTRKSSDFARPMQYVTPQKLSKLKRTAEQYIAQNEIICPARIDVIEIFAPEDLREGMREINNIENVFMEIKP